MRKQSKVFQSKRSGGRQHTPFGYADTAQLTHHVVNDKGNQLAASYGLMNLLRRVGGFWVPRNTHTDKDHPSRRFAEGHDVSHKVEHYGYCPGVHV